MLAIMGTQLPTADKKLTAPHGKQRGVVTTQQTPLRPKKGRRNILSASSNIAEHSLRLFVLQKENNLKKLTVRLATLSELVLRVFASTNSKM
jgi:hypothetical protein